jgi:hypothetical protein
MGFTPEDWMQEVRNEKFASGCHVYRWPAGVNEGLQLFREINSALDNAELPWVLMTCEAEKASRWQPARRSMPSVASGQRQVSK